MNEKKNEWMKLCKEKLPFGELEIKQRKQNLSKKHDVIIITMLCHMDGRLLRFIAQTGSNHNATGTTSSIRPQHTT